MRVVVFKPEHVELADLSGCDVEEFQDIENLKMLSGDNQIAGTFLVDGRITAFAGIMLCEHDVGFVWLVPTVYLKDHYRSTVRALLQYEQQFVDMFKLKELRTNGHDDPLVKKWLKYLGFANREPDNIYVKEC